MVREGSDGGPAELAGDASVEQFEGEMVLGVAPEDVPVSLATFAEGLHPRCS